MQFRKKKPRLKVDAVMVISEDGHFTQMAGM